VSIEDEIDRLRERVEELEAEVSDLHNELNSQQGDLAFHERTKH
jgi:uncharacterized protein YlxW (UPF0749 family)